MDQSGSVLWREPHRIADEQLGEGKAIVAMTFEHMEKSLGLPEGVRLGGVRINAMRGVLEFRFDGPGLPLCAEGAQIKSFESLREAWEYQSGEIEAKDVGAFLNELARIWRERASKALVMVGGKDD